MRRVDVIGAILILSLSFFSTTSTRAAGGSEASGYTSATGPIDRDLEGFFFLDSLTGELKAVALNPRTKKFMAVFSRKIDDDFPKMGEANTGRRYMMSTGVANLTQEPGAPWRWAPSVIYVTELNSGVVVAYGVQLPPGFRNAAVRRRVVGDIMPLDKLELRKQPEQPGMP
jgi:hypothetical protein